jgi:superfamily II DNA or RNA helicase
MQKTESRQFQFLWTPDMDELKSKTLVLICTYSMLSFMGKRAEATEKMINFIRNHDWGLMMLDEVHQVAAKSFREIT